MQAHPTDLKYTRTHEWVRRRGDGVEIGITDFAQHQLSDVTYVELPDIGRHLDAGEGAAVVESIKAASDVYAPVAGVVTEVNTALADAPGVINTDPFGAGWLFRIKPDRPADLDPLLDAAAYAATLPHAKNGS